MFTDRTLTLTLRDLIKGVTSVKNPVSYKQQLHLPTTETHLRTLDLRIQVSPSASGPLCTLSLVPQCRQIAKRMWKLAVLLFEDLQRFLQDGTRQEIRHGGHGVSTWHRKYVKNIKQVTCQMTNVITLIIFMTIRDIYVIYGI